MEAEELVPLYSPASEAEAAVIAGLLDACEIRYFIRGGAFAKLYPGPLIQNYNTQTFMVRYADFADARVLLSDFTAPGEGAVESGRYTLGDKVRILFEALVYGWVIPGRRAKRAQDDEPSA